MNEKLNLPHPPELGDIVLYRSAKTGTVWPAVVVGLPDERGGNIVDLEVFGQHGEKYGLAVFYGVGQTVPGPIAGRWCYRPIETRPAGVLPS